jgi:hypothetical protein
MHNGEHQATVDIDREIIMAPLMFSRKIKEFEYDEDKQTLTIISFSGIKKKYRDVPVSVYEELNSSGDPTRVYHEKIDGRFSIVY